MIIKEREIVQVDTGEVKKLFQWLNRVVNEKLIQAGKDLNKGMDWPDIAFDISEYIKEVSNVIETQICARELTEEEIKNLRNILNSSNNVFHPFRDGPITPPPPKPRKEIAEAASKDPIGKLVKFVKDRSEPIGTAGRAWATLSENRYRFFKDCDYKYVACPNNNYWWVVLDSVTTKRDKKLYVLMTSREEKEKLWCLTAPSDIEVVQ